MIVASEMRAVALSLIATGLALVITAVVLRLSGVRLQVLAESVAHWIRHDDTHPHFELLMQ